MREVKMSKKDTSSLLKPKSAVADFLDILLQESTEQPEIAKPVRLKPKIQLMPELEKQPPVPEVEAVPIIDQREREVVVIEQKQKPQQEINIPVETVQEIEYKFPLQCLMFSVAGNQLSIPIINMGSVLSWGERLTRLPGSPDWLLGVLKYRDLKVKVADTAKIIQIKKSCEQISEIQHILVFGDDNWAITCDELGDVINLNEDDVKWSEQDNKGLFLGTIKESLAILLSPNNILNLLNKHDGKDNES